MRSTVVDSIDDVDASRWNTLAGDNPLATHGWLRNAEQFVPSARPRYLLLTRGDELVGASVCEPVLVNQPSFSPDRLMLRRFHRQARLLGVSWEPATTCVPFRSYRDHLMVDPELKGDSRVAMQERLLDALEEHTLGNGEALWMPRVSATDDTGELLRRRGYLETRTNPVAFMDIEWDSVDGYLAHVRKISKNARSTVRSEMLRLERSGVVIEEIEEPQRYRDRLYALADQHHRRLNHAELPYSPDFIPGLKRNMASDAVIYGAFDGKELIGFSVMLRRNGVGFVPYTGIDPAATRDSFAYFHLCYYRPITDAIALGMRRLYAGTALYSMKARRGFSIDGMRVFYRSASRVRHAALTPLFLAHARWRQRKARIRGEEDIERLRRMIPA